LFTPAADDLNYQLLCAMDSAVTDLFTSNLAEGEVYAGSSLELLGFLCDRSYRESPHVLAALCARVLCASLLAQVEKSQAKAERANTESLKKLQTNLKARRVAPDEVARQSAARIATLVFPVKKDNLLAARECSRSSSSPRRTCRSCKRPTQSSSCARDVRLSESDNQTGDNVHGARSQEGGEMR
jgi:hypothetical protein